MKAHQENIISLIKHLQLHITWYRFSNCIIHNSNAFLFFHYQVWVFGWIENNMTPFFKTSFDFRIHFCVTISVCVCLCLVFELTKAGLALSGFWLSFPRTESGSSLFCSASFFISSLSLSKMAWLGLWSNTGLAPLALSPSWPGARFLDCSDVTSLSLTFLSFCACKEKNR